MGTELKGMDEIISALRGVHEEGVEIVLVSICQKDGFLKLVPEIELHTAEGS